MIKDFATFRRKLEDVVTVAINSGVVVAPSDSNIPGSVCPMACFFPDLVPSRPGGSEMEKRGYIDNWKKGYDFWIGFERSDSAGSDIDYEEFYKLGRLYRNRFGGKAQ